MNRALAVGSSLTVLFAAGVVHQACGGSSSTGDTAGAGAAGGSGPSSGAAGAASAGKGGSGASGKGGGAGKGGSSASGGSSGGGMTGGAGGATGGASGAAGKAGAGGVAGSSAGASGAGPAGGAAGAGGGPTCAPPKTACGGQCVDTATDLGNCGQCGKACGLGEQCCASTCVGTVSCGFSVTKIAPANGWQNGGDYLTITGQGFTPGAKVYLADGRAPAWVKNATTIIAQTPPHPVGLVDVKIVIPTATATLKNAFQYSGNGVELPWQQKPMQKVRGENPGVAVMMNGKVLIAGGTVVPDSTAMAVDTAEIYDRSTDTVTFAANTMGTPRWQNGAVTLLNGKVLVVGGACLQDLTCNGNGAIADLFDPTTSTFTKTAKPMALPRAYVRASLMADGRVFVASATEGSVELYDPVTDSFKQIPHVKRHTFGFVVRLRDGRTMLGGADEISVPGFGTDVEIFDPETETFSATGTMNAPRAMLTAHTLPDGRVIVIGGTNKSAGAVTDPQASIETWDPKTGNWTVQPYALSAGRAWHASALIRDGSILVLGGYPVSGSCMPTATAEQIDPVKNTIMPFGTLPNPNTEWNAVTLLDGSVLAVGGGACGTSSALPDIDFLPGKM